MVSAFSNKNTDMKEIFCLVSLLFIILSSCTAPDTTDDPPEFSGQIVFTTAGSEFIPIITVDELQNPVILWTFADGTTGNTAAPSAASAVNITNLEARDRTVAVN